MRKINDLSFGFRDAENYKKRENRAFFNDVFLRTHSLGELCRQSTYFLVGEKGTGKTAYAIYLANNHYKNNFATLRYIRETEYHKFLELKKSKNLNLSDYTNIWKVIIYLLIAQQIREKEKSSPIFGKLFKFRNLEKAIDEYYQSAFSPEIIYAIQFAEEAKLSAELISKYAKVGGEDKVSVMFTESRYQVNLLYIQKNFEDALSSLKLEHNQLLFIDGIDIRPSFIAYEDYLECVKGLANAVWSINNDFFANIKDSKGRMRVVLLVRPDILDSLGLQNLNSKVRDNSAVLNWITTYPDYRNSAIFSMTDRLLNVQQNETLEHGKAWDYYFPYYSSTVKSPHRNPTAFIVFLRYSLYRPRDILTMLSIQKENFIEQRRKPNDKFHEEDFKNPAFTRKYSDYLLGEVKDHLSFYYTTEDYGVFLKFFQFLKGRSRFSYDRYIAAFSAFSEFLSNSSVQPPGFCNSADEFLQFLYDLNIVCSIRDTNAGPFFGYCYRDRSPSNIAPKVLTGVRYDVHYGLMKALNLGKKY